MVLVVLALVALAVVAIQTSNGCSIPGAGAPMVEYTPPTIYPIAR